MIAFAHCINCITIGGLVESRGERNRKLEEHTNIVYLVVEEYTDEKTNWNVIWSVSIT